jgi:hypothetical protein
MKRITVRDVANAMRVEPTKQQMWAIGARVRDLYEQRTGREPPKELREKSAGGGTHCFATYPLSWREKIEEVIRAHRAAATRQGNLF